MRPMHTTPRLASRSSIAAALGLALALSACAPAESEYVGEDRSGLTEQVDARSPVVPGPGDGEEMTADGDMADGEASE